MEKERHFNYVKCDNEKFLGSNRHIIDRILSTKGLLFETPNISEGVEEMR